MNIRKLLSADYDKFYSMRISMLESKSKNYTAGASDWKNATKEQVMFYLKENEDNSDNFVLGAFDEDQLVGMIGFRRETREAVQHKGSFWGLFQVEDNDKHEIERKLIKESIKIVSVYSNFDYIRTQQNASSKSKLAMFEEIGFHLYGTEEKSMKIDGVYFDQVYLKLEV